MVKRNRIGTLFFSLALIGCTAAVDDEEIEDSESSLIEGAAEGSKQTTAIATTVRAGARVVRDFVRTNVSVELGFDVRPIVREANEGPGEAARAALELHRSLLEERGFMDAAAALNQFLSPDPSDPSGAISEVGDGSVCTSFGGFFLAGALAETDPPLARLVVDHDATADESCRIDGTVHYDLRVAANADGGQTITLVMAYPDGLSIQPGSGAPFVISTGGSISTGLAFDASNAFSAVEAGADYCVSRGSTTPACFERVELAITGASIAVNVVDLACPTCGSRFGDAFVDGLAGDQVELNVGTSLAMEAAGTLTYGDLGLTLGDSTTPIFFEVAYDSTDGWSALVDGRATTTMGGDVATYAFSATPGSSGRGFVATKPIGEIALTLEGCAARTNDASERTTTACFTDLELLAEEGDRDGSIQVTANGELTYGTPSSDATYTFNAMSVDVLGPSAILDGSVNRATSGANRTVLFEGFDIVRSSSEYSLSGVVESLQDETTIVRAEFCDGSTFAYDGSETTTTTLTGCVELTSPTYGTLVLGDPESSMTATLAPTVTTIDGPLSYDTPSMRRIASIIFEGWRAENLDDGSLDVDYHSRVTGRATLDVLGVQGSIESTTGIESRVTTADTDTQTVQLDGDVAIDINVGPQTIAGGMTFTGYTATFMEQTEQHVVAHMGVLDVTLGDAALLPWSSMQVTFGNETSPFITSTTADTTTINGRALLGVGCSSGTCNENMNIVLTEVAFDTPSCGRQHPHTGTAVISGLVPSTSALIPALRVRCECNGRAGRETLLPRRVTMVFTEATPPDRRIQIPEASGVCGLRVNATCNEPGAAWLREDSICM